MNLSNQLAIELRFNESSLVLEVVGLLHSLPTIAEQNRKHGTHRLTLLAF
jgi:hypothetical protein